MSKQVREIIEIDEDLCDGCGQCILSCAEGALQIIDGKARLVSETLCDGFGNCVGSCPQDAMKIIRREADDFDENEVEKHMETFNPEIAAGTSERKPAQPQPPVSKTILPVSNSQRAFPPAAHGGGCPGSAMRSFEAPSAGTSVSSSPTDEIPSTLTQWPVQLMLVPPTAPFLKGREILLAADCCPFAYADFHRKYLAGKALLVGCPKLDDIDHYRAKLEQIFAQSGCTGVTVMTMEVPCCSGLNMIAREAVKASGRNIALKEIVIGIRGEVLRETK